MKGKFSEYRHREFKYILWWGKSVQYLLCNPDMGEQKGSWALQRGIVLHLHCLAAAAPDVVSRAATLPQFTTANQGEMLAHLSLLELWLQQDQNSAQVLVASRDVKVCSQIWSADIYTTTSCSLYFYFEGRVLWRPIGCSCIINFLQL